MRGRDQLVTLANVFFAIWPIGMPLLCAALLYGAYKTKRGASSLLARATAPLSREYDSFSYYWEVLEIVRRLLLNAFLLAIPSQQSTMRLTIALITCFLYLVLLFTLRPFKRADDTQERRRLEVVAFFSNPRGSTAELHLMREIQELFDAAQWGCARRGSLPPACPPPSSPPMPP